MSETAIQEDVKTTLIGEFEAGQMNELESLEQFEDMFGKYAPTFVNVPENLQKKILSYIRVKVPNPLSSILEKIKTKYEIERTIDVFLDKRTKFSPKEFWAVVEYLTTMCKKYENMNS